MARVRKDEDYLKKKNEIIEAAMKILLTEGYDKLGVNYLLRVMNMSKGAFFHYFKSKDELFEGVLEHLKRPIIDNMRVIQGDDQLNAKEKFVHLYQETASLKVSYGEGLEMLSQVLYQERNKPILNQVNDRTIIECQPIYEAVIQEGVKEGFFEVIYIHGMAYHILAMTFRLNQAIAEFMMSNRSNQKREQLIEKIKTFEFIVKQSLNCSELTPLYDLSVLKRGGIL